MASLRTGTLRTTTSSSLGGGGAAAGAGAPAAPDRAATVMDRLRSLYFDKVKPLEDAYNFGDFYTPSWKPSDFDSKPMVLLLGQYSVGKTSFIRYIIGRDFPGARIGPEPTTDRFHAVLGGMEDRVLPGNAVAVDQSLPFTSLTKFGTEFLNKFVASMCRSPTLDKITFVDSPGVLSGEKQKMGRAYDFVKVVEWFAQQADMILLLFDAHKLDISDEFQQVIRACKGHDDKIRVVLNKADKVTSQQLMRVYGAMMWSLGKVVNTPEVMRVYIGSFWDGEYSNMELAPMFRAEQTDLLRDLHELPRYAAVRKINELVKRTRMARVHAVIIGHLKSQMPSVFGQASAQRKMLENLEDEFFNVMKKHRLPQGDFPNLGRFKDVAATFDWSKFKKLDEKMILAADDALSAGIPALLAQLGLELNERATRERELHSSFMEGAGAASVSSAALSEHARFGAEPSSNPFGGAPAMKDPYIMWSGLINKSEADAVFKLQPGGMDGRLSGTDAKDVLLESGLDVTSLRRIWDMSDIDKDGFLDRDEFAITWYLINMMKNGKPLPDELPDNLIPPTKK